MYECMIVCCLTWAAWVYFRTYSDDRLMKSNPDAWKEKMLQDAEARERRRKTVGDVTLKGLAYVKAWTKR